MHCPIKPAGGDAPRTPINGTFVGQLVDIKEVKKKKFQSEEMGDYLRFRFELPSISSSVIKDTSVSSHEKSNLVAFVKQLAGGLEEQTRRDPAKLWVLIQSLVGRDYYVQVVHEKNFNKVVTVLPLPTQAQVQPQLKEEDLTTAATDDDIQF